MKIKTKSGFVCDVDPDIAKDWRFCKNLAKCDSEDESTMIQGLTFVIPFLLGKNGEEKLSEHIKDEKGIVPVSRMIEEFREIMVLMGDELKKSKPSQE